MCVHGYERNEPEGTKNDEEKIKEKKKKLPCTHACLYIFM